MYLQRTCSLLRKRRRPAFEHFTWHGASPALYTNASLQSVLHPSQVKNYVAWRLLLAILVHHVSRCPLISERQATHRQLKLVSGMQCESGEFRTHRPARGFDKFATQAWQFAKSDFRDVGQWQGNSAAPFHRFACLRDMPEGVANDEHWLCLLLRR